ncbi:hypothetical protein BC826DRAFT_633834 [Russula brevipes]|nr:hypothetical protein BC826DRAFT_633834 [Russula brevipes]
MSPTLVVSGGGCRMHCSKGPASPPTDPSPLLLYSLPPSPLTVPSSMFPTLVVSGGGCRTRCSKGPASPPTDPGPLLLYSLHFLTPPREARPFDSLLLSRSQGCYQAFAIFRLRSSNFSDDSECCRALIKGSAGHLRYLDIRLVHLRQCRSGLVLDDLEHAVQTLDKCIVTWELWPDQCSCACLMFKCRA